MLVLPSIFSEVKYQTVKVRDSEEFGKRLLLLEMKQKQKQIEEGNSDDAWRVKERGRGV